MADDSAPPEPSCQLRRRRSSGNPNLGLNLEVGYHVNEGGPTQGTPSPGCIKFASSREPSSSSALLEFRKKQQSFDIQLFGRTLHETLGYHANEGCLSQGTPSPGCIKFASSRDPSSSSALLEFRKKQQSFDIQIEECEEEEILIESDEETEPGTPAPRADRAVTPTPIQDFAANVVYTEGPQISDFLKVKTLEQDCLTDVSDADSEAEGEE